MCPGRRQNSFGDQLQSVSHPKVPGPTIETTPMLFADEKDLGEKGKTEDFTVIATRKKSLVSQEGLGYRPETEGLVLVKGTDNLLFVLEGTAEYDVGRFGGVWKVNEKNSMICLKIH